MSYDPCAGREDQQPSGDDRFLLPACVMQAEKIMPTEAPHRVQAEKINSRAAMIGFFSLLALEAIAGKGILELLGLNIGNGLNIGF